MDYIAGIDGGGTKTLLQCQDIQGNKILESRFGAFNFNSIGIDAFNLLLDEIVSTLDSLGNCMSLCIGAAGISNKVMIEAIEARLRKSNIENYQICGDHVIALEGGLDGEKGIAVIAGTGSICFGKSDSNLIDRTGGWGHLIGDEGSAYAIGRDIFKACARVLDGYGVETVLTSFLKKEFNLETREDIIEYVYTNDKSGIAKVSRIVDSAYEEGDETAKAIVRSNAQELAETICGLAAKLKLKSADVVLLGGLLEKDTPLKLELIRCLGDMNQNLHCISPKKKAIDGAVMLALRNYKRRN